MSVVQDRRVRLLFAGLAISLFGDRTLFIVLPLWAEDLTGKVSAASLAIWIIMLASVLAPIVGYLIDRFPRDRVIFTSNIISAGGIALSFTVNSPDDLYLVIIISGFYSLSVIFSMVTAAALIKQMIPDSQISSANSLWLLQGNLCTVVGSVLGSWVYQQFGIRWVALCYVLCHAIGIVLIAGSRIPRPEQPPTRGPLFAGLYGGIDYINKTRILAHLSKINIMTNLSYGLYLLMLVIMSKALSYSASMTGQITGLHWAGFVVAVLIVKKWNHKFHAFQLCRNGLILAIIGSAILWFQNVTMVLIGVFILGIGYSIFMTVVSITTVRYTPEGLQGRTTGVMILLYAEVPYAISAALVNGFFVGVGYQSLLAVMIGGYLLAMFVLMLGGVIRRSTSQPTTTVNFEPASNPDNLSVAKTG